MTLAHRIALENPMVQAEMIEASEFYELAMRYNVHGVPQTVINEGVGIIIGAVSDDTLVQEVIHAIDNP